MRQVVRLADGAVKPDSRLVLDYAGLDLAQQLLTGMFPPALSRNVGVQILVGLAYLHSRGGRTAT